MGLHKSIDDAEVAIFHIQSLWIKAKDQQQSKHKKWPTFPVVFDTTPKWQEIAISSRRAPAKLCIAPVQSGAFNVNDG